MGVGVIFLAVLGRLGSLGRLVRLPVCAEPVYPGRLPQIVLGLVVIGKMLAEDPDSLICRGEQLRYATEMEKEPILDGGEAFAEEHLLIVLIFLTEALELIVDSRVVERGVCIVATDGFPCAAEHVVDPIREFCRLL